LRLFSFGGYGLAFAALALVVCGAIECPPKSHLPDAISNTVISDAFDGVDCLQSRFDHVHRIDAEGGGGAGRATGEERPVKHRLSVVSLRPQRIQISEEREIYGGERNIPQSSCGSSAVQSEDTSFSEQVSGELQGGGLYDFLAR